MKFFYLVPPITGSFHAQGFEIARHTNKLLAKHHGWFFMNYDPDSPPTLFEYVCKLIEKFPVEIEELRKQGLPIRILLVDCYFVMTQLAHERFNAVDSYLPAKEILNGMQDQWEIMKCQAFRTKKRPMNVSTLSRYAAMQLFIDTERTDVLDRQQLKTVWNTPMVSPFIEKASTLILENRQGRAHHDTRLATPFSCNEVGEEYLFWSDPMKLKNLVKEYEECLAR